MPSLSDDGVAPAGDENLFVLVPLAAGLEDSDAMRETCYAAVMDRLERHTVARPPPGAGTEAGAAPLLCEPLAPRSAGPQTRRPRALP